MVERLRTLSVEPPKGLGFTYWVGGLWSSLLPHPYQSSPVGPLPFGRAPKGSIDLLGSQISN